MFVISFPTEHTINKILNVCAMKYSYANDMQLNSEVGRLIWKIKW